MDAGKLKQLKSLWKEFAKTYDGIERPEVYLCRHNNKWYLTMMDDRSIFYFYSLTAGKSQVTHGFFITD